MRSEFYFQFDLKLSDGNMNYIFLHRENLFGKVKFLTYTSGNIMLNIQSRYQHLNRGFTHDNGNPKL
jgi:hypothetical protein